MDTTTQIVIGVAFVILGGGAFYFWGLVQRCYRIMNIQNNTIDTLQGTIRTQEDNLDIQRNTVRALTFLCQFYENIITNPVALHTKRKSDLN